MRDVTVSKICSQATSPSQLEGHPPIRNCKKLKSKDDGTFTDSIMEIRRNLPRLGHTRMLELISLATQIPEKLIGMSWLTTRTCRRIGGIKTLPQTLSNRLRRSTQNQLSPSQRMSSHNGQYRGTTP